MNRMRYLENVRSTQAAIDRDPVEAAVFALFCLSDAQLLELQSRLERAQKGRETFSRTVNLVLTTPDKGDGR